MLKEDWVKITLASVALYTSFAVDQSYQTEPCCWLYDAFLKSMPCVLIGVGVWSMPLTIGFWLSAMGDFFLASRDSDLGFLLGLGAFLLSQWVFVYSFLTAKTKETEEKEAVYMPIHFFDENFELVETQLITSTSSGTLGGLLPSLDLTSMGGKIKLLFMLASYGYAAYLFNLLYPSIKAADGGLELPVTFYCFSIATMMASAIHYQSFLGITGAILFVISDSYLSLNMFLKPMPHSKLIIMSTYFAAQLLLGMTFKESQDKLKRIQQYLEACFDFQKVSMEAATKIE